MDNVNRSYSRQSAGSPELWLTPLIGMVLLGPLIYHWRVPFAEASRHVGDLRLHLRENIWLDIAIGIIPLFAGAYVQRLLRSWLSPVWLQGLAAGAIGGLLVGTVYYYALHPLPQWSRPYDEGSGNLIVIFVDDIYSLAIVGGFALIASVIATWAILKVQNTAPSS